MANLVLSRRTTIVGSSNKGITLSNFQSFPLLPLTKILFLFPIHTILTLVNSDLWYLECTYLDALTLVNSNLYCLKCAYLHVLTLIDSDLYCLECVYLHGPILLFSSINNDHDDA